MTYASWSEIRLPSTNARWRSAATTDQDAGTAMWSILNRPSIWCGESAVGICRSRRSIASRMARRPAFDPAHSGPDTAWFQSPPQTVGRALSIAATASAVFSPVVEPTHGTRDPQLRHGRIEAQNETPSMSAIALAPCGSRRGLNALCVAIAAHLRFCAMSPDARRTFQPGRSTRSETSVRSQTSQPIVSIRPRCRPSQRPWRFHVPIRMRAR